MAGKLSMAEFKALQQAKNAVTAGRVKEREGDMPAAKLIFEEAASSSQGSISARLALAIHLWGDARTQGDLAEVEMVMKDALAIAEVSKSQQELDVAAIVLAKMCLLLCQEGRKEEARALLIKDGYEFKLSDDVLRYHLSADPNDVPPNDDERKTFVHAANNALPADMLAYLQQCFTPQGAFWREHDYHSEESGYFSYLHALADKPSSRFEQVLHHIWRTTAAHFPAVKEAKFCEWWAHCRPHASGHQMHFDSDDEGVGGVRNPIISTVIYLTEGVGGPTLVTDQRITDSTIARKGWMVLPALNRLVMFDGTALHGVVPGRGIGGKGGGLRRITLMVAFWRDIQERPCDEPGASRPFPVKGKTKYTWCEEMYEPCKGWDKTSSHEYATVASVHEVGQVWERVDGGGGGCDGMPEYDACFQGF